MNLPATEEWSIPPKIARALRDCDEGPTIVIIPALVRAEASYYSADDIHAVRQVKAAGFSATLLHKDDRKFLTEMSAGVLVTVALGIVGNMSADALVAMAQYIRDRAGIILSKRLIESTDAVEVDVRVARVEKSPDGTVRLEGVQVRGSALGASLALTSTLAEPDARKQLIDRVTALYEQKDDGDEA